MVGKYRTPLITVRWHWSLLSHAGCNVSLYHKHILSCTGNGSNIKAHNFATQPYGTTLSLIIARVNIRLQLQLWKKTYFEACCTSSSWFTKQNAAAGLRSFPKLLPQNTCIPQRQFTLPWTPMPLLSQGVLWLTDILSLFFPLNNTPDWAGPFLLTIYRDHWYEPKQMHMFFRQIHAIPSKSS